jgi:hypothetical protein
MPLLENSCASDRRVSAGNERLWVAENPSLLESDTRKSKVLRIRWKFEVA